jgi:hypothetical protein
MFKRALYFFAKEDEKEVSEALLQAFPGLKFVDDQHWPTACPPLAAGIHECNSGLAYLWPSDLVPELPFLELPAARRYANIRFQGPSAGPVIQFCRCRKKNGFLELGQADASIKDATSPLGTWHAKVIAFLKKRYRCGLDSYDSKTGELLKKNLRDFLVGKSIQDNSTSAPRLVLAMGRDEYLIPTGRVAEPFSCPPRQVKTKELGTF